MGGTAFKVLSYAFAFRTVRRLCICDKLFRQILHQCRNAARARILHQNAPSLFRLPVVLALDRRQVDMVVLRDTGLPRGVNLDETDDHGF